jgi:hypothetical protein
MSKRRSLTAEARSYTIENLQHGLGLVPWGYDAETQQEGEVPIEQARRVCCVECKTSWRSNQQEYIVRHMQKHHGMSYGDAITGATGGKWRDDQRAELRKELERLLGGKLKF